MGLHMALPIIKTCECQLLTIKANLGQTYRSNGYQYVIPTPRSGRCKHHQLHPNKDQRNSHGSERDSGPGWPNIAVGKSTCYSRYVMRR